MLLLSVKNPQMAALCWMAGALVLLLSAGNTLAAVDQNELAGIVDELLNKYRPSYYDAKRQRKTPMFSVAVTIPYNQQTGKYDVNQVTDSADRVRNTIVGCDVYTGSRVVAATLLKWPDVVTQCPNGRVQWEVPEGCPTTTWAELYTKCRDAFNPVGADHAEYRTLQHFNTLLQSPNNNDLLLFFVLASPCSNKCTIEGGKASILGTIKQILNWNNHAVVFSYVFKPRSGQSIPERELQGAIERLGNSVGLDNIFRCHRKDNRMQCQSCSHSGQVAPYCISDNLQPQQGRSQSPSKSGQGSSGVRNIGGWGGSSGRGMNPSGYGSAGNRGGWGGSSGRGKSPSGNGSAGNRGGGVGSSGRGWSPSGYSSASNSEGGGGSSRRGRSPSGYGSARNRGGGGGSSGRGWSPSGNGSAGNRGARGGSSGRGWSPSGYGSASNRGGGGGSSRRGRSSSGNGSAGNRGARGGSSGRGWSPSGYGSASNRGGGRGRRASMRGGK